MRADWLRNQIEQVAREARRRGTGPPREPGLDFSYATDGELRAAIDGGEEARAELADVVRERMARGEKPVEPPRRRIRKRTREGRQAEAQRSVERAETRREAAPEAGSSCTTSPEPDDDRVLGRFAIGYRWRAAASRDEETLASRG